MKQIRYENFKSIQSGIIACLIITFVMGLFSCSDDNETVDNLLPPTIVKVCVWDEDIEEWIIPGAESKIRIGTLCVLRGTNMARRLPSISMVVISLFMQRGQCDRACYSDIPVDEGEIKEVNVNLIRVVNKAGAATCTANDFQFFGRQITVTGFR